MYVRSNCSKSSFTCAEQRCETHCVPGDVPTTQMYEQSRPESAATHELHNAGAVQMDVIMV